MLAIYVTNAVYLKPAFARNAIASKLLLQRQCGTIVRIDLLRPGIPPWLELACP